MVRESQVEAYLRKRIKEAGGEIRKVKWIGRNNAPDDRVMLPRLQPCWVEVKAPGEKPTAAQAREHDRMRNLHELVYVVSTYEEVDSLVEFGYV